MDGRIGRSVLACGAMGIAGGLGWAVQNEGMKEDRQVTADQAERDRQAILDHIRSIFEAYIRRDRKMIRATHSRDWTGFQGPSTGIERGIDAYMKNADKSLENLRGTGYELIDTEVQLFGDIGIVYYVGRYDYRDGDGRNGSLPLRSVDIYRRLPSGWTQIGSHITPIPIGGRWGETTGAATAGGTVAPAPDGG